MTCTFCGSPSAHPSTGCQYGPRTLACRACVVECWAWVRRHTGGKARRARRRADGTVQPVPARSFYEAAGMK